MTPDARALASYLAETLPADGQSFGDYMQAALARWPGLSDADISWAIVRASTMSRDQGRRMLRIADLLEQANNRGEEATE